MPVIQICAVRDRAIDSFGTPIFVPAIGLAIRSFSDEVNRPDSHFFAHAEDFDLYLLGQFDDSVGALLPLDKPRQISIGKDVKRPKD